MRSIVDKAEDVNEVEIEKGAEIRFRVYASLIGVVLLVFKNAKLTIAPSPPQGPKSAVNGR